MLIPLVEETVGWRQIVDEALVPFVTSAGDAWSAAGREARDHILLVMQNSPNRTPEEILARWDVQQALQVVFDEAKSSAADSVRGAWEAGTQTGNDHASSQLDALGIGPSREVKPSESVLQGTLSDLDRNANLARTRFEQAVRGQDPRRDLTKATDEMARRARYSAQTSGYTAHTLAQERAFAQAQARAGVRVQKMWVTRFGPGTCPHCAALHGTVVGVGQPFDWKKTLHPRWKPPKPYLGQLWGPPRHPNCRCITVPFLSKMEPERLRLMDLAATWWIAVAKSLGLGR